MKISFLKKLIPVFVFFHSPFLFAQAPPKPFAVVELFTSEGCSSCPPADKLLSKIIADSKKDHKNIFCLEYHVDYWNHGGWKDPFSKNQFTMRQNIYSSALKQLELYTPQMIVNGETEFTGSNSGKAEAAISGALGTASKMTLLVRLDSIANDSISLHYASSQTDKNYSIHFVVVESALTSKIGKGENSGMTITHDNVVRIFYSIDLKEKTGTARIPLKGLKINDSCDLITFVQQKQTMKIFAASENDFTGIFKREEK